MTVIRAPLPSPAPAAAPTTVTLAGSSPALERLAPGTVLLGVVAGRGGGGDVTMISTAEGPIRLPASLALQPGAAVTLQVAAGGPPIKLAILSVRPPEPAPAGSNVPLQESATTGLDEASLVHRWPAIEAANAASPGRLHLPSPGPHLAAAIAQFVVALREADIDRWLDRSTIRAIEVDAGMHVAARVREDFATLAGLATRSDGKDWQLVVVPFLCGTALQQARLYLGRRGSDSEDAESTRRFLLQLAASPFGWLQLDGLVGVKRFDLIVRSERSMPDPLLADLTTMFKRATGRAGYAGVLDFSSGSTVPLPPVARPAPEPRGLLV